MWSKLFPAIKTSHKRWPRIARLERELLRELESSQIAGYDSLARQNLTQSLRDHLTKMRGAIAKLPPRKWQDNSIFYELAFTIGRTLQKHDVPLTLYEEKAGKKIRRGDFTFAVAVAFSACGSSILRVKNYTREALPRLNGPGLFILSEFPHRRRLAETKKKPTPKKTPWRFKPYRPQAVAKAHRSARRR
jgi:hypothetical protein